MKRLVLCFIGVAVTALLCGCGTIKETTTTSTEEQKIPPVVIHDTTLIPIELPLRSEVIDSIGRWYLENFCKGTVEIDKDGLKATISFLVKDNKKKSELIIQQTSEIEKKEQIIRATKTITQKKETPSDWWILWASAKFWIPAIFLGLILGVIGVIILRVKTTLLKFIP